MFTWTSVVGVYVIVITSVTMHLRMLHFLAVQTTSLIKVVYQSKLIYILNTFTASIFTTYNIIYK